jgi:tRNA threonylcarbamoyladenosine biosynthesis protein TsaB
MILALDTSTPVAGVALLDEKSGQVRAVRRARVTTHSEMLLAMARDALAEAGAHPGDLSAIACASGPGSFTGLRIGMATAKGLCFGLGRPLILIPTLQALAARAPSGTLAFACIDAFKGEVYAALYHAGSPPILVGEEQAAPPIRVAAQILAHLAEAPVHVIGDGSARWPELKVAGAISDDVAPPDPADIARLAALRLATGDIDDLADAVPRYIRPSEAEAMLGRKGAPDIK